MSNKKIFFLFLCVLLLIFVATQKLPTNEPVDSTALRFSNTQEWDPDLYRKLDTEIVIVPEALDVISLPAPPTNDSEETKQELEILKGMESERTDEKLVEIYAEVDYLSVPIGDYTYGELTDKETRPHTKYLLEGIMDEFEPLVLKYKERFDRVRPSKLDPKIKTAIEIPGHPAYPSGHSSQTHLLALVMADLDPENKEVYWKSADTVARNREVAGIHYPSDSAAGVLLAEQYYILLKETLWYKTILENAKAEW